MGLVNLGRPVFIFRLRVGFPDVFGLGFDLRMLDLDEQGIAAFDALGQGEGGRWFQGAVGEKGTEVCLRAVCVIYGTGLRATAVETFVEAVAERGLGCRYVGRKVFGIGVRG